MKLKVEINIAEHFSVFWHESKKFSMKSDFFAGGCEITTFSIEEIMGTKLRALYQRKKCSDLFYPLLPVGSEDFDFAQAFDEIGS